MEVSKENLVDSTTQASGEVVKTDTVAYESFKKSVEAEKKARERAQLLEAELNAYKTKELEAQGKYEEITQTLKQQLQEKELALKQERERYAWNTVTGAIKSEAIKHGCKSPEKLIRLFDKTDFETLRAENGEIDSDSLTRLMDKAKKENDFLFTSPAIKINDVNPRGSAPEKPSVKNPKEMTKEELEKAILSLGKR
jgi:hypothetical protein